MSRSEPPADPLDALLIAARAVSDNAQVHILVAGGPEDAPDVVVVVRIGDAAELFRTPPGKLRDGVRQAMERMSGISTRMNASRIRQLLEEARSKP